MADPANHRVEKFDASGHFLLMFGKEANATRVKEREAGEPVTAAEEDVCTAASGNVCQEGKSGSTPGAFEQEPYYNELMVTVDNSGSPSKGDVYVADSVDHLVSKFDAAGDLIETWGNNGQLNGSSATGSVTGPFVAPFAGIAVDSSGDLWVVEENFQLSQLFEFSPEGAFKNGRLILGASRATIGFDAHGNIDASSVGGERAAIASFTPTGTFLGYVTSKTKEFEGYKMFAVDPVTGDLYVANRDEHSIERYEASCAPSQSGCPPAESFGVNHIADPMGLALASPSPADTLYVVESRGAASHAKILAFSLETVPDVVATAATNLTATAATLNGAVDPDGVELSECSFEWGESGASSYEHKAPCEPSGASIGSGEGSEPVLAHITGLQPGHVYRFRLAAGNANDINALIDEPSLSGSSVFGPPTVDSSSVTSVVASAATLQAEVNPDGLQTRARVEYGPEAGALSLSSQEVELGASSSDQQLSVPVQGLQPDTVYHYRVVAENPLGEGPQTAIGPELSFTTQPATVTSSLLDARGWELVSPPDKYGAQLEPIGEQGMIEASATGGALTYLASSPTEADPRGGAFGTQVLSRRTASGWESCDVGLPHAAATGPPIGVGEEYVAFSSDLGSGLVLPTQGDGETWWSSISAEASEATPFLAGFANACDAGPAYRPLVTGCPAMGTCAQPVQEHENVPPGTKFGEEGDENLFYYGPRFAAANADLSSVVVTSQVALVEEEEEGVSVPPGALYEWDNGELSVVSVLPSGNVAGSTLSPQVGSTSAGGSYQSMRGAISEDGSRVAWSESLGSHHLFVWDRATGTSVELDKVQGGSGQGSEEPVFQFMTDDGSRIFFTDTQSLVADSGGEGYGPDLYECEIVTNAEGVLSCKLTDLTPLNGEGESANVQGLIIGASSDGGAVYFVANGELTDKLSASSEEPVKGSCGSQVVSIGAQECNLYEWHEGTTTLVAVLSSEDAPDWGERTAGVGGYVNKLTSRVTGSGEWLAFMSDRSLTGYDNRDAQNASKRDEEVYLYSAGSKRLVCVSCNPTGARPHGVEYSHEGNEAEPNLPLVGGDRVWSGAVWLAANVPTYTPFREGEAEYQSRYLDESGRMFFNSPSDLVPDANNHQQDVYEYEPEGVGSCKAGGEGYVPASKGCLGLISGGESSQESAFLDASEDGDEAFFLTSARLSKRDGDSSLDVYVARVGAVEPEESKPVECQGDACQAPVSPPESLTPSSLTFSGPGNLLVAPPPVAGTKAQRKVRTRTAKKKHKRVKPLKACKRKTKRHKSAGCIKQVRHGSDVTAKSAREVTTRRVG